MSTEHLKAEGYLNVIAGRSSFTHEVRSLLQYLVQAASERKLPEAAAKEFSGRELLTVQLGGKPRVPEITTPG